MRSTRTKWSSHTSWTSCSYRLCRTWLCRTWLCRTLLITWENFIYLQIFLLCASCVYVHKCSFFFFTYTNSLRGSMWVNLYICISVYNVFFFSHIDSRGVRCSFSFCAYIFFFFKYTFLFYVYFPFLHILTVGGEVCGGARGWGQSGLLAPLPWALSQYLRSLFYLGIRSLLPTYQVSFT